MFVSWTDLADTRSSELSNLRLLVQIPEFNASYLFMVTEVDRFQTRGGNK
jgi:hypothetical protein